MADAVDYGQMSGGPPRPPSSGTPAPAATPAASTPAATPAGTWGGTLMYPDDLAESTGDYITFEFYEYKPPYKDTGTGKNLALYNKGYTDVTNNAKANGYPLIHLYMPEDIQSQYASTWGGRDFGPLAGAALVAAGGVLNATKKVLNIS